MKKIYLLLIILLNAFTLHAQLYMTSTGKISFFSATSIENISAHSESVKSAINDATDSILVKATIKTFEFTQPLMKEHFNEKYLESDKYPSATFKGKVSGNIDLSKNGKYTVQATGKLTLHGVTQVRTIDGTLEVKDGMVTLDSKFPVKLVDHKIEVPTVVAAKIAESIDVTVHIVYQPKSK